MTTLLLPNPSLNKKCQVFVPATISCLMLGIEYVQNSFLRKMSIKKKGEKKQIRFKLDTVKRQEEMEEESR